MTLPASSFLVEAFFDQPHLLGVRFAASQLGGPVRSADSMIESFARNRQPDAAKPEWSNIIGGTIGMLMVVGVILSETTCSSSVEHWNGPVITGAVERDSRQDGAWRGNLSNLADDLAPRRTDLRPYAVSVLLDVPRDLARERDVTGGGWLHPRCTSEDNVAYRRGIALARTLTAVELSRETAVILDLPGPQSVAVAAGLATQGDPVFTMDNLPHPAGVVPSAETLGAVIYWRPTFVSARSARDDRSPAVFVLDAARLTPYLNQGDRFDNRSCARLPDATGFTKLGVKRILYVRPHRGDVVEADDLNELFTASSAAGIEIRHLGLDAVDEVAATANLTPTTPASTAGHYYGNWFWNSYGWNRPATFMGGGNTDPDALYRTTPRTPAWASRTTALDGGAHQHDTVIKRLTMPPTVGGTSWSSDGSGGSWTRSTPSSSSWGG
jgi:hypothetical protein